MVPQYEWIIDLAVIASTASSLWLTTFILSRAWYAMASGFVLWDKADKGVSMVISGIATP